MFHRPERTQARVELGIERELRGANIGAGASLTTELEKLRRYSLFGSWKVPSHRIGGVLTLATGTMIAIEVCFNALKGVPCWVYIQAATRWRPSSVVEVKMGMLRRSIACDSATSSVIKAHGLTKALRSILNSSWDGLNQAETRCVITPNAVGASLFVQRLPAYTMFGQLNWGIAEFVSLLNRLDAIGTGGLSVIEPTGGELSDPADVS